MTSASEERVLKIGRLDLGAMKVRREETMLNDGESTWVSRLC